MKKGTPSSPPTFVNLKKYYETHFVAHLHDGLSNTMKNLKPYMLIGIAAWLFLKKWDSAESLCLTLKSNIMKNTFIWERPLHSEQI